MIVSGLCGGLATWHAPDEGDVYWHLALGRSVLRAGSRTVPEPYAIGSLGEPTVVPEWLWGVLTFGTYQLGGFTALTWLAIALGALAGALTALWIDRLCQLAREAGHGPGLPAQVGLSALGFVMLSARLRLRPELLALPLMLLFLLAARRFFRVPTAAYKRSALVLLGLSVLWAQVHGSAILTPLIFAFSADRSALRGERRRPFVITTLALGLSIFSCAHGFDLPRYILDHSASDAAVHIGDMTPATWLNFHPLETPWGLGMLALALSWLAAFALTRFRVGDALLMALGAAMFATAVRFATPLALLGMPLSVAGMAALSEARHTASWGALRPRVVLGLALASAVSLVGWDLRWIDRAHPLFSAGLPSSAFPYRGVRVLRGMLPAGSHVHTPVVGGSVVGFLSDGALQVTIDSRIPLHFNDTEFAAYRDATQDPDAQRLYFERYGVDAAIVSRSTKECVMVKQRMRLVSVDAWHATFVKGQGSALPGIDPCGTDHIERGCPAPQASLRSVRTLLKQRDDAYAHWLDAVVALECKTEPPARVFSVLPAPRSLPVIRDAVARSRARSLWRTGQREAALEEVEDEIALGDTRVLSVISDLWGDDNLPVSELAKLYRRGVRDMDDAVPARERGKLALLCLAEGDLGCAYFQGVRAALRGDRGVRPVLAQLAESHPDPQVRKDVRAWLKALSHAAPAMNADSSGPPPTDPR